ncbi:MAG: VWA domain-containing protein [Pseudomonadota bacterium]
MSGVSWLPEWLVFAWPWLGLVVPVPWLLALLSKRDRRHTPALQLPAGVGFRALGTERGSGLTRFWLPALLLTLGWLALCAAAMRPQSLSESRSAPVTGRNLMLAVDLSGSMNEKDFALNGRSVDRLSATKAVAAQFIDRRAGDRLGLILFGERAYLQTPLTFDRDTLGTLLMEAESGLAGEKTAIGDAIGLAVKRIRESEKKDEEHILVLLTDGANTAGEIDPQKASELAATVGLRIYTIGIGAERSTYRSRVPGLVLPSRDLDEKTLKAIAAQTGGRYFRATDTRSMQAIYDELDKLEPAADDEDGFRTYEELFFWPASLAVLMFALAIPLKTRGRRYEVNE